jgi:hypothetical protein
MKEKTLQELAVSACRAERSGKARKAELAARLTRDYDNPTAALKAVEEIAAEWIRGGKWPVAIPADKKQGAATKQNCCRLLASAVKTAFAEELEGMRIVPSIRPDVPWRIEPVKQVSPLDRALKAYEKLSPQERGQFLNLIGVEVVTEATSTQAAAAA